MRIIGVCGRKGGSGKTTTAVHLAAEMTTRKFSTILVDCDPQGSAKHWAAPGWLPMPVEHRPLHSDKDISRWSSEIRALSADIVLLDSPPHLDAALGGVIGLSQIAVIPCGPSGLDLFATAETVGLVREIRAAKKNAEPRITLVPNRVDQRTAAGRELASELKRLEEDVCPAIHNRTAFSDAFNLGAWVGAYAPNSPAHAEIKELATHVLAFLENKPKRRRR